MKVLAIALTILLAACSTQAAPDPLTELRYCGPPVRLADGSIRRRADVLAAFRKNNPCPSTGKTTGACANWAMNHEFPLACGGCDAVWNLKWERNDVKAKIDQYERKITPPAEGINPAACKLQVVQ